MVRARNARTQMVDVDGAPLTSRTFAVRHATTYYYDQPVEESRHTFRLQPVEDALQGVVRSSIEVSANGEILSFEDVFGNQASYYSISHPYTELTIVGSSEVRLYAKSSEPAIRSKRRDTIPLIWMPWQRQMMTAYLMPPELPEAQLIELTDYAMDFVRRNDANLRRTLKDINETIYRDFNYVQGTTSVSTTPFEVLKNRVGVCQDFANLFICLARLLGIPARYRMGYIHTGTDYDNKLQSEASHAWLEVYLPFVGWQGYDPTNGVEVGQDHVRVACGRNYRDATPTSGTIFRGGGGERLTVDVEMKEIFPDAS
jgi:transglutaminase-like putative cysteine protease